jgi:hypothetical protein
MSPATAAPARNYLVQKRAVNADEWKTVSTNPSLEYSEDIYGKQLKYYTTGTFRLVDPDGKVLKQEHAKFLFSDN